MKGEDSPPARLVVADDHALVREGMRAMLAGEPELEVIGEARNGQEAVELCRRACPDLVLMDVRMPKLNGLEATRAIKEECPQTSILIVTSHQDTEYLLQALKAGAAGYILKEAAKQQVIGAIRECLSGECPLDRDLSVRLIRSLADEVRPREGFADPRTSSAKPIKEQRPRPPALSGQLSPREIEVLRLLAKGQTNQGIARNLLISVSTTKKHVQSIISKLAVSDRTQAAIRAIELGVLDHPEG
jgi:DNA-binding NarL/FixJ family response regulator